eukprot:scaffold257999_cov32-Tisochrysis_lutea.AAC.6
MDDWTDEVMTRHAPRSAIRSARALIDRVMGKQQQLGERDRVLGALQVGDALRRWRRVGQRSDTITVALEYVPINLIERSRGGRSDEPVVIRKVARIDDSHAPLSGSCQWSLDAPNWPWKVPGSAVTIASYALEEVIGFVQASASGATMGSGGVTRGGVGGGETTCAIGFFRGWASWPGTSAVRAEGGCLNSVTAAACAATAICFSPRSARAASSSGRDVRYS